MAYRHEQPSDQGLEAPTLLNAVARTLQLGEMLRHWWTNPKAIELLAVSGFPVPTYRFLSQ